MRSQLAFSVLDLDGSFTEQATFLSVFEPHVYPIHTWGPRLRLACTWRTFRAFSAKLRSIIASVAARACIHFVGSGDFHHVTLALLQTLRGPVNLLVADAHPDWVRGVPFLHCGTWLHHAARLPQVCAVYHVGGLTDFDNRYRWLAPWTMLREGKIRVFPACRPLCGGGWRQLDARPLRDPPQEPVGEERLHGLLAPHSADLAEYPLYVSIDKDVLRADEVATNWDTGALALADLTTVLAAFISAARGRLAGGDLCGDWSAPIMAGLGQKLLSRMHRSAINAQGVAGKNARVNRALLEVLLSATEMRDARPAR